MWYFVHLEVYSSIQVLKEPFSYIVHSLLFNDSKSSDKTEECTTNILMYVRYFVYNLKKHVQF
jgi:hypothetical protein